MRLRALFAVPVALGALAGGASAQTTRPPGWEFSVTPYAWLPALGGIIRTPLPRVGDRDFGLGSGSVVDDLSAIPVMVAGEARYGRFSLLGDFFYAALEQDLDTRDVAWRGGHARVTSAVGTVLGAYRVLDEPRQSLDVGAGARIWNFSTKVSLNAGLEPGAIRNNSATWSDPLLAGRYRAVLSPRLGVTVYADVGGFGAGSRLTWQAVGSLDYDLTHSATLRAGWRYLAVDRTRGGFGVDLGFNGPFFAATFRF
jgi:hypothetical protein